MEYTCAILPSVAFPTVLCFCTLSHKKVNYESNQQDATHHHKHPGLGHLARSVSRVTVALSIVSSVFQMFSFLVSCSGVIFKGIRFCGILCRCKSQFGLYSSILSSMQSVCSLRCMESFVLWSLKVV